MKKAIVAGAGGFIGCAVVRELLTHGVDVIALVHRDCDAVKLAGARMLTFDMAESGRLPEIITDRDIDAFFHLAWSDSYGNKRGDPCTQLDNVRYSVNLLQAAQKLGCARFLCMGSIMEREMISSVYTQGHRPGRDAVYGAAKLCAHGMMEYMAAEIGIDIVWPMITNAYGPGEVSSRFICSTLHKILSGEPLEFTSATQIYDFIYITDAARAIRLIGERGKPFTYYMVGDGRPRPLREYILEIKEYLAPDREFNFGAVPYMGISLGTEEYDIKQLVDDTGFVPEVEFADGIVSTYKWMKQHPSTGGRT